MQKTREQEGSTVLNTRILVVDDHGTLRKRIADYLRTQDGVEEVAEGANGV